MQRRNPEPRKQLTFLVPLLYPDLMYHISNSHEDMAPGSLGPFSNLLEGHWAGEGTQAGRESHCQESTSPSFDLGQWRTEEVPRLEGQSRTGQEILSILLAMPVVTIQQLVTPHPVPTLQEGESCSKGSICQQLAGRNAQDPASAARCHSALRATLLTDTETCLRASELDNCGRGQEVQGDVELTQRTKWPQQDTSSTSYCYKESQLILPVLLSSESWCISFFLPHPDHITPFSTWNSFPGEFFLAIILKFSIYTFHISLTSSKKMKWFSMEEHKVFLKYSHCPAPYTDHTHIV